MNVEQLEDRFLVFKNAGYRRSYFSFYVDGNRGSWTFLRFSACRHSTFAAAQETIDTLRQMAAKKRKRRSQSA